MCLLCCVRFGCLACIHSPIHSFLFLFPAAKIHPVVTLNNKETPEDMADLVEYAYGDQASTSWGAIRAADGHPEPYKPFWVEVRTVCCAHHAAHIMLRTA
eukprot:SAG22_NODE_56_length_23716_cov_11.146759_2_plen_100_part_00